MTRVTIAVNSYSKDRPGENRSYNISFNADFSSVREEVDKIYEKFKKKKLKLGGKR